MQRRCGAETFRATGRATMSGVRRLLVGVRMGGLLTVGSVFGPWRGCAVLVFKPVRAGGHDDLVALLFAQAIFGEHAALVLLAVGAAHGRAVGVATATRSLALLRNQFVGRQVGQVVERLDPCLRSEEHTYEL